MGWYAMQFMMNEDYDTKKYRWISLVRVSED